MSEEIERHVNRCLICHFCSFSKLDILNEHGLGIYCRRTGIIKAYLVLSEYEIYELVPANDELVLWCPNDKEEDEDLNNSIKELLK
jgi:hypothetical protein